MKRLDELRPFLLISSERNPTGLNPAIVHVTADSRAVVEGSLFVAIVGDRLDGHRFIADAVRRGATAVAGMVPFEHLSADGVACLAQIPYLQVVESRAALAWACAALHDFPSRSMTVIGVTGTDGKTSTSTLLESILTAATVDDSAQAGRVGVITTVMARIQGVERETGLHVTTPDAPDVQQYLADMRDAGCVYAVLETTSHGLEQGRVAAVDFDVAAVTNITHEHLDYHGSWPAYAAAKARLFRMLLQTESKPDVPRFAVLNADDSASAGLLRAVLDEEAVAYGRRVPVFSYALGEGNSPAASGADVLASEIEYGADRTRFTIHGLGTSFEIETPLVGEFNVQNILCAVTIAAALGVEVEKIRRGVAALEGIVGRMERIDRGQPFLALVDFAHSPASLERALKTVRAVTEGKGRIIAIFGCAGLRDVEKRRLMGAVSGRYADYTVITAEDPRTEDLNTINRAIEAGLRDHAGVDAYAIVPDRAEAIQVAVDMARAGDVVVAFGKGHERSMCYGEIEYPWSDQEVLASALERRMQKGAD